MFTHDAGFGIATLVALLLLAPPGRAEGPNLGQPISQADLAPWDLTIMPDGAGLPPGSGTPAQGKQLFAENCALCHGDNGRGRIVEAAVADNPHPPTGPRSLTSICNFL